MTFGKKTTRTFVRVAFMVVCGLFGMQLKANAQTDNLMIVKYVDWDSGSGVAVVISNPTPNPVNLANYQLRIFGNGSTTPTTTANLKGTLQPCGTILVGNDEYVTTNCRNTASLSNFESFGPGVNGNDVVVLTYTTTPNPLPTLVYQVIDAVGRIGYDPGNNNSQKVNGTNDALYQHTLTRTATNKARYSLTSGTYNPNNLTSANIWPNSSTTNVLGWTVSNATCITNTWTNNTVTANAGPDQTLACKTTNAIQLNNATATAGATVQWSGGKGTFSNPNSLVTTYTPSPQDFSRIKLSFKAINGCSQLTDELIIINGDSTEKAKALVYTPQAPMVGDTVTFTLQPQVANKVMTGNFNYGDGTPLESHKMQAKHVYAKAGTYQVKVATFSMLACPLDSLFQQVVVSEKVIVPPVKVIIPNIFTPNNDGRNDTYKPQLPATSAYEIKIFNRWGSLIFESSDRDKPWDGKDISDGVYFVHLKATYTTGEKLDVKLPVTVVR